MGHDLLNDLLCMFPFAVSSNIPYIQVVHGRRQRTGYRPSKARQLSKALFGELVLRPLVGLQLIKIVFISVSVRQSWDMGGCVIKPGIPVAEMLRHTGEVRSLLIVANDLHREHFDFSAVLRLRKELPLTIAGNNPHLPGVKPAANWEELKKLYRTHRAYVNVTREPEDGYNLATLEAMAGAMPVLTLYHPTSPIRNGYNGLVAHTVDDLIEKGKWLLENPLLAEAMGVRARQTIVEEFSIEKFVHSWNTLLESIR